ncbi:YciI family protein [Corynebacterium tapiri]|uniref:YCII-related domain-containing protein n=1 Tax=Corynebacterium tapiri TaxID=1448266 RepID=A0A5C4U3U6_9CORY|nr:YciI family protein [Corynebacterium tapiri]TNL96789.1 hypothetical protein FHE74_07140 [Corynebacterium tapiri]
MTQFMLAVVYDPADDAPAGSYEAVAAFNADLQESGRFVYACGLMPPSEAVAALPEGVLGDGPVRTAGPQLGGFWVVEATTRSEAEALAVRAASACARPIELREVQGA